MVVSIVGVIVSITAAFSNISIDSFFTIDWDILSLIVLAVTIFGIFSAFFTVLLTMRRHRLVRVYLSYPFIHSERIKKLKVALKDENVVSAESLQPGLRFDDLEKIIKHCQLCFYAVGRTQTAFQKEEFKIMKALGKKVYIIAMDEQGKLPQSLRDEIPLFINDDHFDEKVNDIIMNFK